MIGRLQRPSTALVTLALALVVACGGQPGSSDGAPLSYFDTPDPAPPLDRSRVEQGAGLYSQFCASCHGRDLAGEPDWKTPNADGTYPAPPHDSTGHTWHHPDALLISLIRDSFDGSAMPAFGGTLSDDEISSILEFIKSWWGPEERAFQAQVTQQQQGS